MKNDNVTLDGEVMDYDDLVNLPPDTLSDVFDIMCDVNGKNKLRDKTRAIWAAIIRSFAEAGLRQTVRGVYYKLEGYEIVPKTESGYGVVQRQLKRMRRENVIPWEWITDVSRWALHAKQYDDAEALLRDTQKVYRRDFWRRQPVHVEVWIEKKALAGLVSTVTDFWGVPLFPAGGFSSLTFIHETAKNIKRIGKPACIYYLADYDRSGVQAVESVAKGFEEFDVYETEIITLGVNKRQIREWNLSTRKPKANDVKRHKWPANEMCCELDTIPANVLTKMVDDAIKSHVNPQEYAMHKRIEELERESLIAAFDNYVPVHNY